MFRRGVLTLGAGLNAMRLAPPLVLSQAQADTVLRVFDEALAEVSGGVRLQPDRCFCGIRLQPDLISLRHGARVAPFKEAT